MSAVTHSSSAILNAQICLLRWVEVEIQLKLALKESLEKPRRKEEHSLSPLRDIGKIIFERLSGGVGK